MASKLQRRVVEFLEAWDDSPAHEIEPAVEALREELRATRADSAERTRRSRQTDAAVRQLRRA